MNEILGSGRLAELPSLLESRSAQSCFIIADPGAYEASGVNERLKILLAGMDFTVFTDFAPNPDEASVERALTAARQSDSESVLAVGGGTSIDIAKLVSCCLTSDLARVISSPERITRDLPLIAIPTTAGTGSEATHFAVLYINGVKHSIAHERLLPDACIIDVQLLESVPRSVAAHTGLDAFCQAIESIWSVNSTNESRLCGLEALGLSSLNLESVVNRPNHSSRAAMARAAHLSGKAINISKTTAAHAISYTLTSKFGIPHGLAVALTIGSCLVWNSKITEQDCVDDRGVAHVRNCVDAVVKSLSCDSAEQARDRIADLIGEVGCHTRLSDFGLTDGEIVTVAGAVNTERLGNNPRRLNTSDIESLLRNLL